MKKNYLTNHPWREFLFLCLVIILFSESTYAQTLPANFSRVQVASGLVQTTAMETLPDGRILVCEQAGKLRVIKNGSLLPTPAVTLTNVDFADEKGLIGVVADPNFSTNNFVYLYYTVKEGAERANGFNRIVRYTMSGDVVIASSRTIIYDLSNLVIGTRYHSGGSMIFGKDGMLYVGTGENQQGSAYSQNLEVTHGKILRMTPTGGIPAGNPFTGSGVRSRIWAYGLRNAFTFDIDKITGKIYVNDVGGGLREEINDATPAGRNFGWAEHEGPCTTNCTGFTNPFYHYFRENETTNQTFRTDQGCAITGGVFFNTPSNYPSIYQGKYFFLDFCNNWINYIDPANTAAGKKEFAKMMGWHNVYLKVGADGNLYYLCRGPGRVNSNSIVYKIVYTGGSAPTITQEPTSDTVAQGDNAQFCVVASGSPTLTYQWRKNGVNISGATSSCYTITNVQSSHAGTYSCVVTNGQGSDTSLGATLTVTAPNAKPVANILTPPTNSTYRYGDVFNYSGDGTDQEDGTLPASAFTWDLVLHHNTHTHNDATLPDGVKTGSFTANNDHIDGNVYYELFLTVRDSKGAVGMDSIRVNPITSNLTLQTNPAGLNIRFDLQPRPTPFTAPVVSNTPVPLEAISPQTVNGVTYIFDSWSHGATTASTTITATDNNATYTANFKVAPAPVNFTPTHDAYVRGGIHAATTHGTTDPANLIIKRNPAAQPDNIRETYLKFDLTSLSGTPAVVQLKLFGRIEDATVTNLPVDAFSVSSTTWTESAITWNNKPATSASPIATTTVSDATARYYTWDVTNYVKSEFAAGRKVISIALRSAVEHNPRTLWSSKETGTNPPQLSVIADGGGSNVSPTVSITSPPGGASFTAPAQITINADAADSDGTVTQVAFYNGAALLGTDTSAPYSFSWANVPAGNYSLTARATDNGGAVTTSTAVAISVVSPPSCPAVIASADDGNVAANVLDNNFSTRWSALGDGQWIQFCLETQQTVNGVQIAFYSGNVRASRFDILLSTDGTNFAPGQTGYTSSGTSLALETFNLNTPQSAKYVRILGHGNTVNLWNSYTEVRIQTGTPVNVAPTVSISSPANNASFTAPANITINANAADSDGTVAKVEFFSGATKLGEDLTSPYSFTWTNVAAGTYQLTAVATDNAGASKTSSIVNISVSNNVAPTVAITAPANGATFTAPATITITANASDSDGSVTKVAFGTGGCEDTTAPYSCTTTISSAGTYTLTATATDNLGATATSSVTITVTDPAPGLPAPWANSDIGAVAAAGSASHSSGTFTVNGSGADIWGTADEFHYVYQPASGDVELIARVSSISNTNAWAKAGLMVRETLGAGSINAAVFVSATSGITFQRRTATGGTSVSTVATGISAPIWLKLTRSGNNFTASYSTTGTTWTAVGTAAVTMTASTQVGLAVTSHSDGVIATAPFTNVSVTGPTAPCVPATASADDGNVAANVLDNDLNTRWSASGDPQWIQFCLSSVSSVSGVQIAFYKGNERASIFDILLSTDGVTFTPAASGLRSSGTSLALENFPFTPRNAKYVRIVGHGNSVNLWNSYTEVEITSSAAAADALTTEEIFSADKDALSGFPNPVTNLVTIKYKVEEQGRVTLSIMDSDNNNTTILVDKQMNAGTYQMVYDMKNHSRGVHLIKLVRKGKFTTYKLLKQ